MWSAGKFSRCSMYLGKEQYQWILIEVLMAELYFEWQLEICPSAR